MTNEELANELVGRVGALRDANMPTTAAAVEEAAARLRQQSEDSARLDWLFDKCTGASDSERYLPFRVYWGDGRDARGTIDKARSND